MKFDRVSVNQDDDGQWWLEFYIDDVRHAVNVAEIVRRKQDYMTSEYPEAFEIHREE